jgi:hypothetical protein
MQDLKDKPSISLHTKFDTSVFKGRPNLNPKIGKETVKIRIFEENGNVF